MSDKKPSLYVVEKKEVVILVVLFVLVTVLSFTLGVRYGESIGKKIAKEEEVAETELGGHGDSSGGTLGKKETHDEKPAHNESHSGEKDHSSNESSHAPHGEHESHVESQPVIEEKAPVTNVKDTKSQVDKNSDEYLLDALKTTGLESPESKAKDEQELPSSVKSIKSSRSGQYVVQVGSHPTKVDAQRQVNSLAKKGIQAELLPPFKDRQGQWHRVIVGTYSQKSEADRVARQLKQKGSITSFFVWRHP
ncbi:MAG: SPOR domain-containing protein [Oligoflexia bacterium]|nr:SPOR domain-containing protein [Oligoflexia bacterium]